MTTTPTKAQARGGAAAMSPRRVKPSKMMDNETFRKHLNRGHMPMQTLRPEGSSLTEVPNMTDTLRKVWRAWHMREHRGNPAAQDHTHGDTK